MSVPACTFRFGNVPLSRPDSGAVYTRYFSSEPEQAAWMGSHLPTIIEANYEVRPYSGAFRLNVNADTVTTCNYCAFYNQNGSHWWYAFVDSIVYVNDQVSEVHFTIDALQTFHFRYAVTPVFVEREHASDDTIGANLLDEPVSTGELRYLRQDNLSAMAEQAYIVECNEEPVEASAGSQTKRPCKTGKVNDMYSGCGKFYFAPDQMDALNTFLESMNNVGAGSSIVGIYGIPEQIVEGQFNNGMNIFDSSDNIHINPYQHDVDVSPYGDFDGYTPRNNKLYTYPYNFLRVTNNGQNYHDYRFEFFDNGSSPSFYIAIAIDPTGDCMAYPAGVYNGVNANRNEHVMLGGNPQCSWAYNSYQNWVAQNSASNLLSIVTGAASVLGGAALLASGLGGTGIVAGAGSALGLGARAMTGLQETALLSGSSMAMGGAGSLVNTAGSFLDAQNAPNKQMGASSNSTSVQLVNNYFTFSRMGCQAQFAERIDEFFDVYGYNTQRVKVPDRVGRAHVNYTKTRNAEFDGNVPASFMADINRLYDTGIWWFHDDSIGDFSIANPIV